ncbi:MAG: VWA domain-containing protein [Kiritimatiellae bacterium]|nr:VWA domain-containing protein [Kiritimatiellia bacterium]
MKVKTDNGLAVGQHSFVLFVSIVFSVVMHFSLMYFCGDVGVRTTAVEKRAHITPETLPPVRIETFLQKTELLQASSEQAPDMAVEAEMAAETLPEKVKDVAVPLPALPSIPKAELAPWEKQFLPPEAPEAPMSDALVRQEVAMIPETEMLREINPDPKWIVDQTITRVPDAPDLASSVEMSEVLTLGAMGGMPSLPPIAEEVSLSALAELATAEAAAPETASELPQMVDVAVEQVDALTTAALDATVREVVPELEFQAIDNRLSLALTTYETAKDPAYTYFRLAIVRRPDSPLPIMGKDVIFIQDISGSIGKKRLEHSKEAMKAALYRTLRVGDRFNVFAFRDVTLTPSGTWMTFDPTTYEKAKIFVDSLRALGNTDLFLLLQDLLTLQREPNRPLIAIVVTDGEPTVGVTETTRIIGEFTRMNNGMISVYTFGIKQVNPYFLDMLCYANRGENTSASGNIRAIEGELIPIFDSIRNPVMKDLSIVFATQSGGEIHPKKLTNLYADRALTVYGRVPRGVESLTCQLKGNSSTNPYDAVFTFSLKDAAREETTNLRQAWAERAMFDLLAEYAENPSEALLTRIDQFSKTYGVRNPYAPAK